jgi:EAL domain-containing protein (putative c-di-GMP-specific phosphodiesterase class I)
MGLPVIADGCDSRAHFDAVVSLGCAEAQGRFVAEPMPAAALVAWALAGYQPGESEVVPR